MEHKLGTELKLRCDPSDNKQIAELTDGIKCVVPVGENSQTIDAIVRIYTKALIASDYASPDGTPCKLWFDTDLIEQAQPIGGKNYAGYQLRTAVTYTKGRGEPVVLTTVCQNITETNRNKLWNLNLYTLFREIIFTLAEAKNSPFDGFVVVEREPEVNAQVEIVELSFEESATLLF